MIKAKKQGYTDIMNVAINALDAKYNIETNQAIVSLEVTPIDTGYLMDNIINKIKAVQGFNEADAIRIAEAGLRAITREVLITYLSDSIELI